jgi:hypothetical protein
MALYDLPKVKTRVRFPLPASNREARRARFVAGVAQWQSNAFVKHGS